MAAQQELIPAGWRKTRWSDESAPRWPSRTLMQVGPSSFIGCARTADSWPRLRIAAAMPLWCLHSAHVAEACHGQQFIPLATAFYGHEAVCLQPSWPGRPQNPDNQPIPNLSPGAKPCLRSVKSETLPSTSARGLLSSSPSPGRISRRTIRHCPSLQSRNFVRDGLQKTKNQKLKTVQSQFRQRLPKHLGCTPSRQTLRQLRQVSV